MEEIHKADDEDDDSVTQGQNGSPKNARWTVEFINSAENIIRLKSCYGKYLTASNQPFLLGMTGRKVLQTVPAGRLDSSVEWEPIRGFFRLQGPPDPPRLLLGKYLTASTPPWRNSVTHDIPHRTATQDWVLWDLEEKSRNPFSLCKCIMTSWDLEFWDFN